MGQCQTSNPPPALTIAKLRQEVERAWCVPEPRRHSAFVKRRLSANRSVRYIRLPRQNKEVDDNTDAIVVGWGSTLYFGRNRLAERVTQQRGCSGVLSQDVGRSSSRKLKKATVRTIDQDRCAELEMFTDYDSHELTDEMLCATKHGRDSRNIRNYFPSIVSKFTGRMPQRKKIISITITYTGAMVAERLARSPPTKVNRAQSPAGSPDFRKCRTMLLVGGSFRESPVSSTPSFRSRPIFTSITLIGSQYLAVKSHANLFTHSLRRLGE
ncbi:hypothetical protein PR048_005777 [Dryococelus australis]|uniref:Uncharacterized protein n=1 Tax=Dryococelus australis TaxID=614101 RepID=A0ABQ9I943_9NEOP|nr:hypothetical protein PR048_005777 [Dryococelus australis]